jgi:hypothetical protein
VVDLRHKAFLTANAAFDEPDLPVGRIFAASHSGGMTRRESTSPACGGGRPAEGRSGGGA